MSKRFASVARVGRSYPRLQPEAEAARPRGMLRSYRIIAGLIGVLSALGLIGWLLAR